MAPTRSVLADRRWFLFFLAGGQNFQNFGSDTAQRMAALGENIAVAGSKQGCLFDFGNGRMERQNIKYFALIDVADKPHQINARSRGGINAASP